MIFLNADLTLKESIPLIGAAVVLTTFIIHRIIEHLSKRREIERNWYMKVLVEPSISKVHDFFNSIISSYKDAALLLAANADKTPSDFSNILTLEFGKFQEIKRVFEGAVVFPIQILYLDVGIQITDQLLSLEDTFTGNLDSRLYSAEDVSAFAEFSYSIKARLLQTLYSPLIVR